MACLGCPDEVLSSLRQTVTRELEKILSITRLTNAFNEAFGEIAGSAFATIDSAVNSIPNPSPVNFLGIFDYVLCPLTILTLDIEDLTELTDTDPNTQLQKLKDLGESKINEARRDYESIMASSDQSRLIERVRSYEREIRRVSFDEEGFARALVIAGTVQALCPDEFNDPDAPFLSFATATANFSFVGGVPGNLSSNLQAVISKLAAGELKFAALRATLQGVSI